jgi:transcriptional regulator with XRE-family HTH domain
MLQDEARGLIREARMAAGLSLRDLGRRVGVSASLLSQIENGKSDPSVSSLYALVSELGLSLDALLQPERSEGAVTRLPVEAGTSPVLHEGERRTLDMDSGVRWEQLTPGHDPHVDGLLVTYEPGGQSSSSGQLMTHGGVEYAYLMEGELSLEVGFETYVIGAGDSVRFESSMPHLYRNLGTSRARGIWYVVDRAGTSAGAQGSTGEPAGRPTSAVEVLHARRRS